MKRWALVGDVLVLVSLLAGAVLAYIQEHRDVMWLFATTIGMYVILTITSRRVDLLNERIKLQDESIRLTDQMSVLLSQRLDFMSQRLDLMSQRIATGPCGALGPAIGESVFPQPICTLRAGHDGWHEDTSMDPHPSWSP